MHLLHVVNPVSCAENAHLAHIQSFTLKSMQVACAALPKDVRLTQLAVSTPAAQSHVPNGWVCAPSLTRSMATESPTRFKRPLPFMKDILARAKSYTADFYIYSNIDILLQPSFYAFVCRHLRAGYDALIINRRRIPVLDAPLDVLSLYSTRWGRPHPGFDCFVMSRAILMRIQVANICLGVPFVGVAMAYNLFAHAHKGRLFDAANQTYHLGMQVLPPVDARYYWYNRRLFFGEVVPRLWSFMRPDRLPYATLPWWLRYWKWGWNPSLFVFLNTKLYFKAHRRCMPMQHRTRRTRSH